MMDDKNATIKHKNDIIAELEAVIASLYDYVGKFRDFTGKYFCPSCQQTASTFDEIIHDDSCPVLLAKQLGFYGLTYEELEQLKHD
jgi:hypothetical protein